MKVTRWLALAAAALPLVVGCSKEAPSVGTPGAAAPSASSSAAPSALAVTLELPGPPPGYSSAPLDAPNAVACGYFGGGVTPCKQLRMLAAYGNGAGRFLRVYRVVDAKTGEPMILKKWKFYGHVDKLEDGTSRLEMDDGKLARFWVVKSSVVIEGEEPSANIEALRTAFTDWANAMIPEIAGK
jgi:hypothetical protein